MASLRRAVRLAEGWMKFGIPAARVPDMLAAVATPAGFEVILPSGPLDPGAQGSAVRRRLDRLREAGATLVSCTLSARSATHYTEQLGVLREIAERT